MAEHSVSGLTLSQLGHARRGSIGQVGMIQIMFPDGVWGLNLGLWGSKL